MKHICKERMEVRIDDLVIPVCKANLLYDCQFKITTPIGNHINHFCSKLPTVEQINNAKKRV